MEQQQKILSRAELVHGLRSCFYEWIEALQAFDEQSFNKVPFEGSWTAGQVAEHMLKSVGGIPEVVYGDTATPDREPDAVKKQIDDIFLDFTTKLQSPDFILPSEKWHDKQQYIHDFEQVRDKLIDISNKEDLSLVCTAFSFPQAGPLTRWEWLWFAFAHMVRHTRQLRNIHAKLAE